MAVETESDRNALLADFGETIIVTSGGATFTGIFDNDYLSALGMDSRQPVVLCKDTDVSANSLARNTLLTIRGTSYKVVTPEPDGTGMTVLVLEKQ